MESKEGTVTVESMDMGALRMAPRWCTAQWLSALFGIEVWMSGEVEGRKTRA